MRKYFKRVTPDRDKINSMLGNGLWQRLFGNTLLHPRLWHLSRHTAAGGVAVGLFCGLIPGPLQMLGAALLAVWLRVNLPLALVLTLYTNPLTIIPLYLLAFSLGQWAMGDGKVHFVSPPDYDWQAPAASMQALASWASGLGTPLVIGLLLLASLLAAAGYALVWTAWTLNIGRYQARRRQRTTEKTPPKRP